MYHVNCGAAQSPPASSTPSAFAETARLRCRHVACRSPSTPSLACSYLPPRQAGEPCRDAAQGCLRCAARESRRHAGGSADERLGVQICLRRAACRSRVCVGGSGGYGYALEHASTELRSDRELVLAAVQGSGRASRRHHVVALMHASAELRADREIVLAAVRTDGWALKYVCGELQADREVVLEALQFGMALSYASTGLRADREVVLAAVRQDPRALEFASTELRADQKLVLAALDGRPPACAWTAARAKGWGRSLKHASAELRSDREIVLAAVRQCNDLEGRWVLKHASAELRADREIGDHRDHYSGRLAFSSPPDFLSRMGKGSVRKVDSVSSDYIHISDFWDSA